MVRTQPVNSIHAGVMLDMPLKAKFIDGEGVLNVQTIRFFAATKKFFFLFCCYCVLCSHNPLQVQIRGTNTEATRIAFISFKKMNKKQHIHRLDRTALNLFVFLFVFRLKIFNEQIINDHKICGRKYMLKSVGKILSRLKRFYHKARIRND